MPDLNRRQFLAAATSATVASAASTRPPNVVMIYCDDMGYGDLGCYGSRIRTPNVDRMASEGIRFTHFYSGNPVCSPSRAGLLTGRYPVRAGVPRVLFPTDKTGLPGSEVTIAQMLKARSYASMCIGKWHLGHLPEYLPVNRGFDEYFGIPYSNDMTPRPLLHNTETLEEPAKLETLTPRYTEQALRFIERSKGSPFFLYMAHTYPHIPLGASERFRGRSPLGLYGDVVEELDWSTGEILSALKKHGLDNNTLVMFSSDNGPWYLGSPGHLRGRKGSTYEGGQRVPFIARFPGRIPRGRTCAGVASVLDILPTLSRLCDVPLPGNPPDGIDIWPLIAGQRPALDREALLMFDNTYLQCARWRQWKLHLARYNSAAYSPVPAGGRVNLPLPAPELYDVVNDPDESYDVAPEHPEVVAEIRSRIERLMAGFPDQVRKDWTEAKTRKVAPTAVGNFPRLAN
ncbi:MAG: sulfatase-like hydrolase/transferase [Bryobacterales bacterium]|nr:sulfatase-like hydrolase/transferase [Bryobacterales bacterium]